MTRPTPDDIFKAARHNVVINRALAAWLNASCTWEQAMMAAVLQLAEHNEQLIREVTKQMQQASPADARTPEPVARVERTPSPFESLRIKRR